MPQATCIEPLAELYGQGLGEQRQQAGTVPGPIRPSLLKLHDMPPQFPAGLHLQHVDRA